MKNHLGAKVKVNSRSVYGARGRVNIGIFLTDPTPLKKKVKCMIYIGKMGRVSRVSADPC